MKNYDARALVLEYLIALQSNDDATMMKVLSELTRRDGELAQLRAELARLQPLAQAAVAFNTQPIGKLDTTVGDAWELIRAARAYAQAQDGAA